jgi:hypothetical protein
MIFIYMSHPFLLFCQNFQVFRRPVQRNRTWRRTARRPAGPFRRTHRTGILNPSSAARRNGPAARRTVRPPARSRRTYRQTGILNPSSAARRNGPAARRTVRPPTRSRRTYRRTGGLFKLVGEASPTVSSLLLLPHAHPHLHGRRLLEFSLLLASPPNQTPPNLDRV